MVDRLIGASARRVEDPRLLTGQGRFVDDVSVPGMLEAAFVRSPHPLPGLSPSTRPPPLPCGG